tara:strand:+ start:2823 stop:4271 length:1449 start_codon:yes stop_codon:yes gene_type:complete
MIDVILDLDSTLIFNEKQLSDEELLLGQCVSEGKSPSERNYLHLDIIPLLKEFGSSHRFSLATARSLTDLRRIDIQKIPINHLFLLENGGVVLDKNHAPIPIWDFPQDIKSLTDSLIEQGYQLDQRYDYQTAVIIQSGTKDSAVHTQIIENLHRDFLGEDFYCVSVGRRIFISPIGIGKYSCIQQLITQNFINPFYMAAGNDENDKEMLLHAIRGYVPQSATIAPKLKDEPCITLCPGTSLAASKQLIESIGHATFPLSLVHYYSTPVKQVMLRNDFLDYCRKNHEVGKTISRSLSAKDNLIFVAGISGSTKTFFSNMMGMLNDNYSVLHLDIYADKTSTVGPAVSKTFIPQYFKFDESKNQLNQLLQGTVLHVPIYSHEHRNIGSEHEMVHPNDNYVCEGIHAHNPEFNEFGENHHAIKVLLYASKEYFNAFTRTGKPMSKEVADRRYQSYLKNVYSYSNDAQIILTVNLEHRLHIQKMEV